MRKLNTRNSAAIINEVNKMLKYGFLKKETYKVVGAKYNVSSKIVQRVVNGQEMDIKNKKWTLKIYHWTMQWTMS